MGSTILRIALLSVAALACAPAAAACIDLSQRSQKHRPTLEQELEGVAAVVVGEVIAVDQTNAGPSSPVSVVHTLEVEEILFGHVPPTLKFTARWRQTVLRLDTGTRQLLLLQESDGAYNIDPCGNSADLTRDPGALARYGKPFADAALLRFIDGATSVELYSLDPSTGTGSAAECSGRCFHGWQVLGAARLTAAFDRAAVTQELAGWVAAPEPSPVEPCFEPRRAARIDAGAQRYDFVVSFGCQATRVYAADATEPFAILSAKRNPKAWNGLLGRLQLPRDRTEAR